MHVRINEMTEDARDQRLEFDFRDIPPYLNVPDDPLIVLTGDTQLFEFKAEDSDWPKRHEPYPQRYVFDKDPKASRVVVSVTKDSTLLTMSRAVIWK